MKDSGVRKDLLIFAYEEARKPGKTEALTEAAEVEGWGVTSSDVINSTSCRLEVPGPACGVWPAIFGIFY